MSQYTYFAWKHTGMSAIFQSNFFDPDYRGGLFETEKDAFEAFREYVGQRHVCESVQDNFTLIEVEVTDANPINLSDCPNCSWGQMKRAEVGRIECDECSYRTDIDQGGENND